MATHNLASTAELNIGLIHNAPSGMRSFIKTSILKRLLLLKRLNEIYARVQQRTDDSCFFNKVLQSMNIRYEISDADYARIPQTGPLIVVANHPYGAAEGIALAALLRSVRPDAKILANYMLGSLNIPEFRESFFYVDPFGRKGSIRANIAPLREAISWVESGGMLGVFPSGEVSHLQLRKREISDPKWSNTIARIIRKTKAPVLPLFFGGANSRLFQLLGLVHPLLRTLMLPREMLNKSNKAIPIQVGKPISFEKLSKLEDGSMTDYLRLRTYMLGKRGGESEKKPGGATRYEPEPQMWRQSIAPPQPPHLLTEEIRGIPPDRVLAETDRFAVYHAEADEIPHLLQEIGRLREITFRDVGEGSGNAIDTDRFDPYYIHLFLWDKQANEVVGGYRLGPSDRILEAHGRKGLYTSTLFDYPQQFLERIGPALELGRTFVRTEHQRTYQPLMLLWKGIGRFVTLHPKYKTLIGPVSISNNYLSISRQLIAAFSKQNSRQSELARLIKGNCPMAGVLRGGRKLRDACTLLHDFQDLSEVISDIETDQKGIPILLKHYMKLGGDFLGFTIDRNFSNVMDVLIMVDLTRTNLKALEKYMGKEGADFFLQYHCGKQFARCA